MAQATLQNAIDECGIKRSELAERMSRPKSFISKMLSGSHNLTIKTFALALAACGLEPQFSYAPIQWGWTGGESTAETACAVVPTDGGHFDDNAECFVSGMPITLAA
jgi:hypothetical protein